MREDSKQGEWLDLMEIGSFLLVDLTMLPKIWQGLCPGWTGRGAAKEGEEEEVEEGEVLGEEGMGLVREGKSSMEI